MSQGIEIPAVRIARSVPAVAAVGNFGITDGRPGGGFGDFPYLFYGQTGGYNSLYGAPGSAGVADIAYAPGTTPLMSASHTGPLNAGASAPLTNASPYRPYLDYLTISVQGATSWTGGGYAYIGDSNGNLGIFLPVSCLLANAKLSFGFTNEQRQSFYLTASSYNASTGAVTFPASSFVSSGYTAANPGPFRIVSGTGAGLAGLCTNTSSTTIITPINGAAAFYIQNTPGTSTAAAVDATSVFEFPYWIASAGGNTTVTVGTQAGSATPLTANALENGQWALDVVGTGAGGVKLVNSNTSTVATVSSAWPTNPASGDQILFTNAHVFLGAIDFATGGMPCFGLGAGLEIVVASGMSGGSNLHLEWGGHYGR